MATPGSVCTFDWADGLFFFNVGLVIKYSYFNHFYSFSLNHFA